VFIRHASVKNRDFGMGNKYLVPKGSCFPVRFAAFGGTGGVLILQLFPLGFVSTQIVHLPVPSENFGGRGKKFYRRSPMTGVLRVV
jgi:hypothetical protein